jgi:hypothetical protein
MTTRPITLFQILLLCLSGRFCMAQCFTHFSFPIPSYITYLLTSFLFYLYMYTLHYALHWMYRVRIRAEFPAKVPAVRGGTRTEAKIQIASIQYQKWGSWPPAGYLRIFVEKK